MLSAECVEFKRQLALMFRIENCKLKLELHTQHSALSTQHSALLVHANYSDAKYAGGFIAARGLEAHRHLLLALHHVSGDRVLDIEEAFGRAAGTMPFDSLFADTRAIH